MGFAPKSKRRTISEYAIATPNAKQSEVRSRLEAIATEVEVFEAKFIATMEMIFKERDAKSPSADPIRLARWDQPLFSVFDSNAALLGRIANAELRRKIVARIQISKQLSLPPIIILNDANSGRVFATKKIEASRLLRRDSRSRGGRATLGRPFLSFRHK
jgi:hypothetical protein